MTGERSRLHIKQPYASIYFSSHIIRVIKSRSMRWARHVKLMEKGEVYTGFQRGELEKENTWKTQQKSEDNIKMDIQEMGWGDMEWIDLAQDKDKLWATVNAGMNLRVTKK